MEAYFALSYGGLSIGMEDFKNLRYDEIDRLVELMHQQKMREDKEMEKHRKKSPKKK